MSSYQVWNGSEMSEIEVPHVRGEQTPVPVAAALLFRDDTRSELLLQTRDDDGPAAGLCELPGGIWRAGESPLAALEREVLEETGLALVGGAPEEKVSEAQERRPIVASHPAVVVTGVAAAYPVLILAYEVVAMPGEPRGEPGESRDPRFYPVEAVKEMLTRPAQFTGPTFAILDSYLG